MDQKEWVANQQSMGHHKVGLMLIVLGGGLSFISAMLSYWDYQSLRLYGPVFLEAALWQLMMFYFSLIRSIVLFVTGFIALKKPKVGSNLAIIIGATFLFLAGGRTYGLVLGVTGGICAIIGGVLILKKISESKLSK